MPQFSEFIKAFVSRTKFVTDSIGFGEFITVGKSRRLAIPDSMQLSDVVVVTAGSTADSIAAAATSGRPGAATINAVTSAVVLTPVPMRYTTFSTETWTLVNGLPKASADTSREPLLTRTGSGPSGYWKIYAYPNSSTKVDISSFRGAPTVVSSLTTTDPFGPAAATLVFPAVTILEQVGTGALSWLTPETNVDIVWVNADPTWGAVGIARYTWEGYLVSYEYSADESGSGLTVSCKGALHQLDNYLAQPENVSQPLPYEYAIRRKFFDPRSGYASLRKDLRTSTPALSTSAFPSTWTTTFSATDSAYDASWKVPQGITTGDKWTGLLTRSTGTWEPCLTGYIANLLTTMQYATGKFTMVCNTNRTPALAWRPYITDAASVPLNGGSVLNVDLTWPGVSMSVTQDYTQRANVAYNQGTAAGGTVYTGMQTSVDGSLTYYEPASYTSSVYPTVTSNTAFNKNVMRKEVKLDFGEALTPKEAKVASDAYLLNFQDPGITGSLTLDIDPVDQSGRPYPRHIVMAGCTILVKGLLGNNAGVFMHVTEASISTEGTLSLTLDSKYRDQLTVDQVRLRGRDALVPFRSISTKGTYAAPLPDLQYPWNYTAGSGVMPGWDKTNATYGTQSLFQRAATFLLNYNTSLVPPFTDEADLVEFPWTDYTTRFPPSTWPGYYMYVPARSATNPNMNWANKNYSAAKTDAQNLDVGNWAPYTVRLGAAGDIKMIQIAAYNADGTVKKVPFHVSIYSSSGISYTTMPSIQPGYTMPIDTIYSAATNSAQLNTHFPFFAEAWERTLVDGSIPGDQAFRIAADGNSFIAGWGTFYERAGYWPGSSAKRGDTATGLLVDEAGFSWDYRQMPSKIFQDLSYSDQLTHNPPANVDAFLMIYCESTTPTYFLGRLWRKEVGSE